MAFLQTYFSGELKSVTALNQGLTSIGRHNDNDLVIDNAGVSSHHAIISQEGDDLIIEDLNSTNGVFVNGVRVHRQQIRYGDEISIHKYKLKLTAVDLSGGVVAPLVGKDAISNQSRTMEVDVSQLQAMLMQQHALVPYLQQTSGELAGHKWLLAKQYFSIGKGRDCELYVAGWFTPRLIAKISRQSDGYYLYPENHWCKVRINGSVVKNRTRLQNRDRLQVRDIALTFCQPMTPPSGGT